VNLSHAKRTDSDILKGFFDIHFFIFIMRIKYIVIQLSLLKETMIEDTYWREESILW
jgi:hypothetical protein